MNVNLNKEICRNCPERLWFYRIDKQFPLSEFEKLWAEGIVSCPIYLGKLQIKNISMEDFTKKNEAQCCPFILEHALENQK